MTADLGHRAQNSVASPGAIEHGAHDNIGGVCVLPTGRLIPGTCAQAALHIYIYYIDIYVHAQIINLPRQSVIADLPLS